jgi:hypothetical protein
LEKIEIEMQRDQDARTASRSPSEVGDIVETIKRAFHARRPLSLPEIASVIFEKFGKSLLEDTLHHLLTRDPRIKTCWGKLIDERRLTVGDEAISAYFALLMSTVSGAPAHFIFNMDEMGQSWVHAPETVYFVHSKLTESAIYVPVSRIGKRITLIACIAADHMHSQSFSMRIPSRHPSEQSAPCIDWIGAFHMQNCSNSL